MKAGIVSLTSAIVVSLAACTDPNERRLAPEEPRPWQDDFTLDRSELASRGSNLFFVLEPGYELVYRGKEDGQDVDLVITVLDETERVDGVDTRVVEERESHAGKLVEVSRNYFAISSRTHDVYYFGEDVDMFAHGEVVSHEGAWRSGEHGAHYGLMMPAVPEVGMRFQCEEAPHVAMDRCEVVSLDASIETPAGSFAHCLEVAESTPLEPDSRESKVYARHVGLVRDSTLLLTQHGMAR
jgi:hypothetical protein